MPAAVARPEPLLVALPNALKDGFFGSPTGAERNNVDGGVGREVECLDADNTGLAGSVAAIGTPSLAAVDVATGRLELPAVAVLGGLGDAGAAGGGVAKQ